ncbi:S8 family serine peptidase [Spirillospora sp. CA-253888]
MILIGISASPGAAARKPGPPQWPFDIWAVEQDLWPHSKGQGITVAVIDSGVQASVPDLAGAVIPGTDMEFGGDGRSDTNPEIPARGHGTQMAALIAAGGQGTGFMGVAPQAKIMPVVAQRDAAVAKGIRYAADRGAKVINLSVATAGPCPTDMQDAVTHALDKGAVVVAGAGNDGNSSNASMHPANCAGALAVGAVDIDARPWSKSQRQPYVTVAAPGVRAGSVGPEGKFDLNYSGTSDASALTSGVAALVRAKYPNMSNREVVRQIIASAKDIGPQGRDEVTGYGFIRPYRIFQNMIPKNSPNPVFAAHDRQAKGSAKDSPATGKPGADTSATDVPTLVFFVAAAVLAIGLMVVAFIRGRRNRSAPLPVAPRQAPLVPGFPPSHPYPQQPQPRQGPPPTRYDIPEQGDPQGRD